MEPTKTMRALVVDGARGTFREAVLPRPEPHAGEVLVKIYASGVNPLDLKIRAGEAPHARHAFPAVLGLDLAGRVVSVGEGVTTFRPGDAVYGMTGGVGGLQGSLAEFAAVDARLLAPKPSRLSMREAAALPLVVITAWEGLIDRAGVHMGQKVLVHGGAGGVGHIAVQLAKSLGADVFATGRAAQADLIRSHGARPIDFTTVSVDEYVSEYTSGAGFDVIYDTVGGAALDASFGAVRAYGGHVVSCLGWGTHKLAPLSFRAATYSGVFTLLPLLTGRGRENHGHILREAARLVDAGKLRPHLDPQRFDFDSVLAAHEHLERGLAHGKIAIDMAE